MKLEKKISFVYTGAAAKKIYMPIADEAEYRGYEVEFTDNKFARCEIGLYCDYVNIPNIVSFL